MLHCIATGWNLVGAVDEVGRIHSYFRSAFMLSHLCPCIVCSQILYLDTHRWCFSRLRSSCSGLIRIDSGYPHTHCKANHVYVGVHAGAHGVGHLHIREVFELIKGKRSVFWFAHSGDQLRYHLGRISKPSKNWAPRMHRSRARITRYVVVGGGEGRGSAGIECQPELMQPYLPS